MSTIDTTNFISKAHNLVKKALESEEYGLLDEAIEFNSQAANYFNLAILQTTNDQTINALKILSQNHAAKANDLRQYNDINILNKLHSNNRNTNDSQSINNNNSQSESITSISSIINYASPVTPTTESAMLNNSDFYPNSNSNSNSNQSVPFNQFTQNDTISITPLTQWFGIEKLMDILPKPQMIFQRYKNNLTHNQNHSQSHSQSQNHGRSNKDSLGIKDGSLLSSFYMVESESELDRDSFEYFNYQHQYRQQNQQQQHHQQQSSSSRGVLGGSDGSTSSGSVYMDTNMGGSMSSSMIEESNLKLQQELNLVNQTVKVLIDENERTARYLRNITQENIYLKRCIIQFRQEMNRELEKKTSKMKIITTESINNSNTFDNNNQNENQ